MKAKICIILIVILMLGVSGCMSNEPKNTGASTQSGGDFKKISLELMERDILSYLEKKYGETFEMDKLVREFGGDSGIYYRAVFHSGDRPEKGVLYCRADGEGAAVKMDGVDCVLTDDYANVILQEQYAAALQAELGGDVLVKCRLKTPDGMVSDEDFAAGLEACLENVQIGPHLYVVVLADASEMNSGLKEKAEAFMDRLNVYRQYLYIGYQNQIDLNAWEKRYLDNNEEFERYLVDESDIEYVHFSAFHLNEGLVKNSVLKE